MADDEDRAGIAGGFLLRVGGEESGDGGSVGGGEAQAVVAIVTDEPLDRSVAEAAEAVVDDEESVAELGGGVDGDGLAREGHSVGRMWGEPVAMQQRRARSDIWRVGSRGS